MLQNLYPESLHFKPYDYDSSGAAASYDFLGHEELPRLELQSSRSKKSSCMSGIWKFGVSAFGADDFVAFFMQGFKPRPWGSGNSLACKPQGGGLSGPSLMCSCVEIHVS